MKPSFCLIQDLRTETFLSQGDASNVCVGRGHDAQLNKKDVALYSRYVSVFSIEL